ncbi:IPTL-CTERM sorting domain-containing protein [Ottowia sp. VDI28]|uniref:IPTL-CTERM sorting domain-containing protein n=1 Tax=Ottowia sp. VDI28 TaxID=3133968 RepID=UPI003C2C7647
MKTRVLGLALLACSTWANAASFSYTGSPVPIPDSPGANTPGVLASAPITVSGLTQPIAKVTLSIDGTTCTSAQGATTVGIDHSFVNDLQISLRAPSGTSVLVINRTDGGGNNLCQVVLDDDSSGPSIQSVASASAPFTGTYTPNAPLSAFMGEDANGVWELQAQDFFISDIGSIRAWTLNLTEMQAQAITFTSAAPVGAIVGGSPYVVTATGGGSNNPVIFSIDSSASAVCSIAGSDVTFLAPGACVINANQAGNDEYSAAPQVQQTFQVAAVPVPKPITAVPTLGEWSLILLAAIAGALGVRAQRRS